MNGRIVSNLQFRPLSPRTPRGDARLSRIFTDHDNSIDKYDILQAQGRQREEAEISLEPGSSEMPAGSLRAFFFSFFFFASS
jgi:hypothetical protein